uniref:Glycosyltransferase n=1 Tax=Pithovirus LCPAC406 TaxID=2506599 RepID=A0A481ZDD9_9VIRU|nr:MAG: glycosyltransferase [Pithovirus LCPAC406]
MKMRHILTLILVLIVIFFFIYAIWFLLTIHHTPQEFDPAPRDRRIVVSFSTIPSRMKYIPEMIKKLENQTLIPDAIYFNLPYKSIKENKDYPDFKIPDTYLNVIVNRCEDVGPLTKLLPTLEKELDPETIIIIIDDDVVYQDYVFEKLVEASTDSVKTVYSNSGWQYRHWPGFGKEGSNMMPFYTFQGVESVVHGISGVVFKRKFFGDDFHPIDECFMVDDVLISSYLSLHGFILIKLRHPWLKSKISNDITLSSYNMINWPYEKCRVACAKEWSRDENIMYADFDRCKI